MSVKLDYHTIMPLLAEHSKDYVEKVLLHEASEITGSKVLGREALLEITKDPVKSAKIFFGNFAFARAGGQQAKYNDVCVELLKKGLKWKNGESFYWNQV